MHRALGDWADARPGRRLFLMTAEAGTNTTQTTTEVGALDLAEMLASWASVDLARRVVLLVAARHAR